MEFGYHQIQEGKGSIEFLGKTKFEEMHGVDLELEIQKYQWRYLQEHPEVKWQ